MATYTELFNLRSSSDLRNKIAVAAVVKAQAIIDLASPTAGQIQWAEQAIADPVSKADALMHYVIAANKTATVAQILSASDATIQTNVDAAVNKIIAGGS